MPRGKHFGKRKFQGNQFSQLAKPAENKTGDVNCSASKKKAKYDFEERASGNVVIQLDILSALLKQVVKCKNCDEVGTIDIFEEINSRRGLAVCLLLTCTACGYSTTTMSSSISHLSYDVNVRLVYAMRCIGKGENAARTFCAIMNLPPPPTKFERYHNMLLDSLSSVSNASMLKSVEEAVVLNNGSRDIAAAFDGSWQKRGHTSNIGVLTATSLDNNKIIDFDCFSKFYIFICRNNNHSIHKCQQNYTGYSGGMEIAGAMNIFRRSKATRNVRYVKCLGNGDSKGYQAVADENVYGTDEKTKKGLHGELILFKFPLFMQCNTAI